jgi:peptide chain release factor subunit 1
MATKTITRGRLRRLAELRPEQGRVLSVYFDLDPQTFGTPPARVSQISSLLDEANRMIDAGDFDHAELVALREDVQRIRTQLADPAIAQGGVRGMAVFACGPADVLEVVKLPHTVDSGVFIDRSPMIEPLATSFDEERWCVVLVSRQDGRILVGDRNGLEQVERVTDDVKGQHQQGGWSQARYQRSVEREKAWHLDDLAEETFRVLRRRGFDHLLIGGPDPLDAEFEQRLHPYVTEKLAGRIDIDVENSTVQQVLEVATPLIDEWRAGREQEALARLREGLGRTEGRAAAGFEDVIAALNEQRVEMVLVDPRAELPSGYHDPETGYLSAHPGAAPSAAGGALEERGDTIEIVIEKALEQAAEIMFLSGQPDLGPHGGIAALLRF